MERRPSTSAAETHVAVLGLGAMGAAIAHALLAAGHRVTVWNRSPGRAQTLAAAGARVADTPAAAVAAAQLTVICVLDAAAVAEVVQTAGAAIRGAALVNLTSSTPEQAREVAALATGLGGHYLDGKIMVPTPLVGTDASFVIYSGERSVYDAYRPVLEALGPAADLLGDDPGQAALYDLAMVDIFFQGMAAFLHATALVGPDGHSATAFLPYARRMLDVLAISIEGLASDIGTKSYSGKEDNLVMDRAGIGHIIEASRARGVDTSMPSAVLRLIERAIANGHAADGFSSVIEALTDRAEVAPQSNAGL